MHSTVIEFVKIFPNLVKLFRERQNGRKRNRYSLIEKGEIERKIKRERESMRELKG